MTGAAHELGLAQLVIPAKRARYAEQLASAKHRVKFVRALSHFHDWDSRYVVAIGTVFSSEQAVAWLRQRGAGPMCWIVSEYAEYDQKVSELEPAIALVYGRGYGVIVSCIPGRLAYFEDEDGRYFLYRCD